jgi:hypothetical protein
VGRVERALQRVDHARRRNIELKSPNETLALYGSGGAMLSVMRAVLDELAPKDADVHHAESVLRMLGLSRKDAAEVSRRTLSTASAALQARRSS